MSKEIEQFKEWAWNVCTLDEIPGDIVYILGDVVEYIDAVKEQKEAWKAAALASEEMQAMPSEYADSLYAKARELDPDEG